MDDNRPKDGRPPSDFLGNFSGYVKQVRDELEAAAWESDDPAPFDTAAERLDAEASFFAAQDWLVERWGEHFPCPVCRNEEWIVSEVGPALRPSGFLAFAVSCGYCGNTMQVVPGRAYLNEPAHKNQLQFPEPQ